MKRSQVITVAAVAIILGLFWFTYTSHREPHYNGKSLTEWLEIYRSVPSQEAADAVRHIGTNALPFLLTWVQEQRMLAKVSQWKSGTPGREFVLRLISARELRGERAYGGFEILGGTARDAAPDLARAVIRGDRGSANLAIVALCFIGRDDLQPLFSIVTNTAAPLWTRTEALNWLSQMPYLATNSRPAITLLVRCLHEPDLAEDAGYTLGNIHLEGDLCVPALIECTRSTNETMRMCAAVSLGGFRRTARAAILDLTRLLNDPAFPVRVRATNALGVIAPEVMQQTSAR